MVQWLRLLASIAGGMGSIPGRGAKIPHAPRRGQKKKKKGSLKNWLILGLGEKIYKMIPEHLVTSDCEKATGVMSKMTQEPT